MYEEYWGLREKPFENTPNPRFYYRSPEHEETFARMLYAIRERKGAAVISGEYGSGKTLLGRSLMQELDDDRYEVAFLFNPKLSPLQFLKELVHQLGGNGKDNDKVRLMRNLNEILYTNYRRGKDTVILIDEAQAIPDQEVFEEIRLLLNFQLNERFLLTLLLVGQPELREKVAAIPQFAQRVAVQYHLKGLTHEETVGYIQHRLRIAGAYYNMFLDESYSLIYAGSGGIPRRINQICDLSLFEGLGGRVSRIGLEIIKSILGEMDSVPFEEKAVLGGGR